MSILGLQAPFPTVGAWRRRKYIFTNHDWISQSFNDKAVLRTASATLGLLKRKNNNNNNCNTYTLISFITPWHCFKIVISNKEWKCFKKELWVHICGWFSNSSQDRIHLLCGLGIYMSIGIVLWASKCWGARCVVAFMKPISCYSNFHKS